MIFNHIKKRLERCTTLLTIPGSIRFHKKLKENQKMFYVMLLWLSQIYGKLNYTDKQLADIYDKPVRTIQQWLFDLKDHDFIKVEYVNDKREIVLLQYEIKPLKGNQQLLKLTNYYSIIPGAVFDSNKINSREKLLYAEITALTRSCGYCFIGYDNLAKLTNTSLKTIYRSLDNLETCGFIKRTKDTKGKPIIYVKYGDNVNINYAAIPSKKAPQPKVDYSRPPLDAETEEVLDQIWKSIK